LSEIIAYAALIPPLRGKKAQMAAHFGGPPRRSRQAGQKGNGFFTFSVASFAELVYTASLIPR